ncbi:hypothetical protein AB6887_00385 [Carnobacterium divergens]|uniref:DUF4352 domain-containing protein n=1 Tax=Carnobacterium divergens TaxID=2748 RepID=A0A5F0MWA4_CARDV|nr:hypothetical protein [Carnobacterium divergens]MCO6019131.1 hypothetical protein [Carnobacterium divergens]TFI63578.1 hypothetical protein CKN62_05415 [Carnobacterium divergens]TFI73939.1 hypothetical protein CKN58_05080 [Carnobacterium divergens]TFI77909.1 hypothetical protein CKN85_05075 [Carnobacterium divergens]TFI84750.1 hypothetical protein CKN56_05050 [Carnobacterium divergens]
MKRLSLLIMTVTLSLGLLACGTDKSESTNDNSNKVSENKKNSSEQGKNDYKNLKIGETAVVEIFTDQDYKYELTLNSVEYADGEINGYTEVSYDFPGFFILDITIKNLGPAVNYAQMLQFSYSNNDVYPSILGTEYGLMKFGDENKKLEKNEVITGRVATLSGGKHGGIMETKVQGFMSDFSFQVEDSEVKDYKQGDQ